MVLDYGLGASFFLIGLCLSLVGYTVFIAAFTQFLKRKGLLISGLYSIVRHPQYLGIVLAAFGFTLLQYNMRLMTLISWIILVLAYVWLAEKEEIGLQEKFGEAFLDYKSRVPFFMPSLIRKRENEKRMLCYGLF